MMNVNKTMEDVVRFVTTHLEVIDVYVMKVTV